MYTGIFDQKNRYIIFKKIKYHYKMRFKFNDQKIADCFPHIS